MLNHDSQNQKTEQNQKPESLMDLLGPEEFEIRPGYNEKPEAPDLIPMEQQIENLKKAESPSVKITQVLCNYYEVEERGKKFKLAYSKDELVATAMDMIDDIFTLGSELYCIHEGKLHQLNNHEKLYGILHYCGGVVWNSKISGTPTKSEFRNLLTLSVPAYDGVCCIPQYPKLSRVKYLSKDVEPKQTGRIDEFVDKFFFPYTEADKKLLKAALVSPFSTAPSKPFLLFDTVSGGQFSGKTKVVEKITKVCGGCIRLSEEAFKKGSRSSERAYEKILLRNEMSKAAVFIDNIVNKLDSSVFAEMITAMDFSHRTAHGSDTSGRINNLTFFGTTNISKICRDAATRTVKVNLSPPPNDAGFATWETRINKYIEEYQDELIADALYYLKIPCEYALNQKVRGASWFTDVLSKFCESQKDFDAIIRGLIQDIDNNDSERESAERIDLELDRWMNRYEQFRGLFKDEPLFISKEALIHMIPAEEIFSSRSQNQIKSKITEWTKSGLFKRLKKPSSRNEKLHSNGPRGYLYNVSENRQAKYVIDWDSGMQKCILITPKGKPAGFSLYPPNYIGNGY